MYITCAHKLSPLSKHNLIKDQKRDLVVDFLPCGHRIGGI